jgi:hypothetical protein
VQILLIALTRAIDVLALVVCLLLRAVASPGAKALRIPVYCLLLLVLHLPALRKVLLWCRHGHPRPSIRRPHSTSAATPTASAGAAQGCVVAQRRRLRAAAVVQQLLKGLADVPHVQPLRRRHLAQLSQVLRVRLGVVVALLPVPLLPVITLLPVIACIVGVSGGVASVHVQPVMTVTLRMTVTVPGMLMTVAVTPSVIIMIVLVLICVVVGRLSVCVLLVLLVDRWIGTLLRG